MTRSGQLTHDDAREVETIKLSQLFCSEYYRLLSRISAKSEDDLIVHYIREGEAKGFQPNPLFDPSYYNLQIKGGLKDKLLLVHYLEVGWAQGLCPHPLFDTAYYCTHNSDVVAVGINPLRHFLASGGYEGRRPHPLFNSWNYSQSVPGLIAAKANPLLHYLRQGWREGRNPHFLFDGEYYLATQLDVAYAGQNPLYHFVTKGLAEGRNPNPLFSMEAFNKSEIPRDRLDDALMQATCFAERNSTDDHVMLREEIKRRRGGRAAGGVGMTRLVAFFLPQFHPIPENDLHWGKGFTEWTNVRSAVANFEGHDQPRQPGELGYYDLRDPTVMERQAELAREYGIHGFCFYWYWFNGQKPLAAPLEQMLESGKPDFPFCLCWANEQWTRKWDGSEQVIFSHSYSPEDDFRHATDLARYLRDPRYIRVGGAPLLLVYRAGALPDSPLYIQTWREIFRRVGVGEVHLALVESAELAWAGRDPCALGFDSAVEFPPHGANEQLPQHPKMLNQRFSGAFFDYRQVVLRYATTPPPPYPRFRTVMGAWDNTARYQNSPAVFINANPGGYRAWLEATIREAQGSALQDNRLVFVNAWNEWGEGTYLEPDQRWGRAYLEATRDALLEAGGMPNGEAKENEH